MKDVRHAVVFVSLIIFCYQIKTGLEKLISEPTVDSSEFFPIYDLSEPPIITLCPRNNIATTKLQP